MRRVLIKKFIYYFGWALIIGFITTLGSKFKSTYLLEIEVAAYYVSFSIIFPIVIGALLKLPNLIIEIKQNKKWGFDWIKFTAILLPYLFIMLASILPFIFSGKGIIAVPDIISFGSPTIQNISGVVLGYILLDSLKKDV